METFDKVAAAFLDQVENARRDAGHDPVAGDRVPGVGQLDAVLRDGPAHRAHAERDDVHRPACTRTLSIILETG